MNTRVRDNYLYIFVIPLFCAMAASSAVPPSEQGAQTDVQTAYFCWTNQVQWAQEPLWPVTVSIMDKDCNALASIPVTSEAPFIISAELKPGEYQIMSELPNNYPPGIYWDAHGTRVKVEEDGTLAVMYEQDLRHLKTMTPLTPIKKETVTELRPVLKWEPFPGATYYRVLWFEHNQDGGRFIKTEQGMKTDVPEYRFEEDVVPGRKYEWAVDAYDQSNRRLAYWSASYFTTPDDTKDE